MPYGLVTGLPTHPAMAASSPVQLCCFGSHTTVFDAETARLINSKQCLLSMMKRPCPQCLVVVEMPWISVTTTLAKPGGLGGSCHVPPACATTQLLVTVQHGDTKCQWVCPVSHRAWVVVHSLPLGICCRADAAHGVPWLRAIAVQRWLVEGSCKSRFHAADAQCQQKQKQRHHA